MKNKLYNICLTIIILILTFAPSSQSCVGKILYIGALNTPESKLMAELLVTLINERTGTNVKVRLANSRNDLYASFKTHDENSRIDIIVENTAEAMTQLHRARISDPNQEFNEVKRIYEKDLELIWLSPFGFKGGSANDAICAPLLRLDILNNFPLLPRILNKLSGAIDTKTYNVLLGKIKNGDNPKNVAKDFLKERKFI